MINSFGYKNLEALILQMFVWLGARNVVDVVGNSRSWLTLSLYRISVKRIPLSAHVSYFLNPPQVPGRKMVLPGFPDEATGSERLRNQPRSWGRVAEMGFGTQNWEFNAWL